MRQTISATEYDYGLRKYMMSIYGWVIAGLLVSAMSAYGSHITGFATVMKEHSVLFFAMLLAPFGLIVAISWGMSKRSAVSTLAIYYLVLTMCEGFVFSTIAERYTGTDLSVAFLSALVAFSGAALFGYTTRINLLGMGSYVLMALIGLIAASVIAIVFHSTIMHFIISVVGVIVFIGITAYDSQKMRSDYSAYSHEDNRRAAVWNALDLYLDFINIMLYILNFFNSDD